VAAERARAQHALEVAERQYRVAERAKSADPEALRRVHEGLGDVLMLRGRYDEAERFFEAALASVRSGAEAGVARATIDGKLGELYFKRGDVEKASAAIERALRMLGRAVPSSPAMLFAMLVVEVWVQLLHTLFPRWFVARLPRPANDEDAHEGGEFLAARLYSRLAYTYWFQRGKFACLWAHLREMNLLERYPASLELAQAYSEHAPVMTMVPYFERGAAYAEKSMAIRKEHGDVWGQGQSLNFHGTVLYAQARYDEAIKEFREAIRLLERTGDRWEQNTAAWHIALCRYRMGELAGARVDAQELYRAGHEIGDHQAMGIALGIWAKASNGKAPEELVRAELRRKSEDVHTFAEVLGAESLACTAAGRHAEATLALEKADRVIRAKGLQQEYVTPVVPFLAGALREQAIDPALGYAPRVRKALLARAERVARRARRLARLYPNNLPHALRESGLIAALRNQPRRARRFLDESLDVAERQGMRAERFWTLQARARVGRSLGWHDSDADQRAAREARKGLGFDAKQTLDPARAVTRDVVSLSLADRFPRGLEAGRLIVATTRKEAWFAAVEDAALALLRCEKCVVAEVGAAGDASANAGDAETEGQQSSSAVRRALASGKVVVLTEGIGGDTNGAILSNARSTLCAPIFARGRAVAYFYATHANVGGLFGAVEEQLAEFIAAIAGAALENAEGFAAQERLYAQAQAAVGLRDEFLAVASHELRTPLTALSLNVTALRRGIQTEAPAPAQAALRIEKIDAQARRLTKLIDNLLDVARITHGRITLTREAVDLTALVRETTDRLEEAAQKAGSPLCVVASGPVEGVWDRVRLEQVITNLCTNAIKFGAGKPIDVVVETDRDNPKRARLAVRDRGIGIPPEAQDRIFERFERAASTQHYGGLGLGLWITRQTLEAMGGSIRVESAVGQGATFVVELPREAVTLH
jgi:signal transduction histidine kinase/Tfp pilus assembly protein PilF